MRSSTIVLFATLVIVALAMTLGGAVIGREIHPAAGLIPYIIGLYISFGVVQWFAEQGVNRFGSAVAIVLAVAVAIAI